MVNSLFVYHQYSLLQCPQVVVQADAMLGHQLMEAPAACEDGIFMVKACPGENPDRTQSMLDRRQTAIEQYKYAFVW